MTILSWALSIRFITIRLSVMRMLMNCSGGQKNGGDEMQNFIITLLICSVTMSVLGIFYMAVTPLLAERYSPKGQYLSLIHI